MRQKSLFFILLYFLCAHTTMGFSAIVQVNGKWTSDKHAPTLPLADHFKRGVGSLHAEKWDEALHDFLVIALHFPNTPHYAESLYYSGLCYFHLKDYDLANRYFSSYLEEPSHPHFFEEVFQYKYQIANLFTEGKRKHLFGMASMPRLKSAKQDALDLYDEVIATLPNHELASLSLYGKAELLRMKRDYKESIDTLYTLTRRFPKSELAIEAYVFISNIYLEQIQGDTQNPDLIELAKVNQGRFQKQFPSEERVAEVERHLLEMEEIAAKSLYETGLYFERKKKAPASKIYFQEAAKRFSATSFGQLSQKKLA